MIKGLFNSDGFITFKEDTHQYFDVTGDEYGSVSKVIGKIKTPFDKATISRAIGNKLAKELGVSSEEGQRRILAEWKAKADSSIIRGNFIHNNLEDYLLTGSCDSSLKDVVTQLMTLLKGNYKNFPEALIYSPKYKISGQSDLVVQRTRSNASVFDIFDYKTNESKGIQFDSIDRRKAEPKHYNRYMLPPFDHLEDCNFIHYSMQLSIYAYMAQETWGIKIGRLAILFIDNDLKMHTIPVPYMKMEAKALLDYNASLKPLPKYAPAVAYASTEDTNEEDW